MDEEEDDDGERGESEEDAQNEEGSSRQLARGAALRAATEAESILGIRREEQPM